MFCTVLMSSTAALAKVWPEVLAVKVVVAVAVDVGEVAVVVGVVVGAEEVEGTL
jgi:hypothetical protein